MIRYNNPNENWRKRQNYYDRREKESGEVIKQIVKTLLVCLAFALLGWLLSGCTTTKYVPVIETHTDTLIHTVHHRDSIYMHDSIRVSEKGDTVKIERWHTQYRDRWRHDTIYQARHDTVPQPYPVEKLVPAELSWWQQARIHLANILLAGLLIAGIILLGKWHLKKLQP